MHYGLKEAKEWPHHSCKCTHSLTPPEGARYGAELLSIVAQSLRQNCGLDDRVVNHPLVLGAVVDLVQGVVLEGSQYDDFLGRQVRDFNSTAIHVFVRYIIERC